MRSPASDDAAGSRGSATRYAYLQGAALNLKPGDGFAIVPGFGDASDAGTFRALTAVDADPDAGTHVS